MEQTKKAFTLVELIVVITIIAILGTIAFISLEGYGRDSRDSVRISDMSSMKTSLELYNINSGKYPETTDPYNVLYSGVTAWTQGYFGDQTFTNVDKLDDLPLDPLVSRKYIYSVTNNKQEFEIAGIMESDLAGINNELLNQTNAGDKIINLKITGNYNGKFLKVSTGGIDYVLNVPSIIASTGGTLDYIINNNALAYDGYSNLPFQYDDSIYNTMGESPLIALVNPGFLVAYSGSFTDLSDEGTTGVTARTTLITNAQDAYAGTAIENEGGISEIVLVDLSNPDAVDEISRPIVNNDLSGDIEVIVNNSDESIPAPSYIYSCEGLLGDAGLFPDFDLCTDTIVLSSLDNILTSSALTGISGSRDIYAFVLENGRTYDIETLGDDSNSDTAIYLYDKDGNFLVMNDDISGTIWRSKISHTTTYDGYYFLGVMGYNDGGTSADYTLKITAYTGDGVCGADNGLDLYFTPTNLCENGVPVGFVDNGVGLTYNWDCEGLSGWTDSSCSANHLENPYENCTGINTPAIGDASIILTSTHGLCSAPDIMVCTGLGTGFTVAACNAGTIIAGTGTTSYGGLYQWGNNFDFRGDQFTNGEIYPTISTTKVPTTTSESQYSNATFIKTTTDWTSDPNPNLWGDSTDTYIARKGPCEIGYHVPSAQEWLSTALLWTPGIDMTNELLLPVSGRRRGGDAALSNLGSYGYYWSSSPDGTSASYLFLAYDYFHPNSTNVRSYGYSVRCFKN